MKNITIELNEYNYSIFKLICNENKTTYSNEITKYILNNKNIIPERVNIEKPTKTVLSLPEEIYKVIKNNPYTNKSIINYIIYTYIDKLDKNKLLEYEKILKENSNKAKPKRKCFNNYNDFKYQDKELEILNSTILTKEQLARSNKLKEVLINTKFEPIAEDIYKLFTNGYSPNDLGVVYFKSSRTIQNYIKKAGLNRDKYEAQAIAKTKRNYKEISNKGRETLIKNNTIVNGSNQENYLRNILNCKLSLLLGGYEVIVGVNNRSILNEGKEVDIPIIVMTEFGKIYKFAIEYDGSFWHENKEKDKNKNKLLVDRGYKVFRIGYDGFKTDKQIKEFIENKTYDIACFIAMASFSGARKSELIQYKDSFFTDKSLKGGLYVTPEIRTKGKGVAGKPMKKYCLKSKVDQYLNLWRETRKEIGVDIDDLFVVKRDGKFRPATSATATCYMKICTEILKKPVYAHSFRHFFVSYLSAQNVPIAVIRDIVGHESSETTEIYNDNPKEDGFLKYFSEDGIVQIKEKSLDDI